MTMSDGPFFPQLPRIRSENLGFKVDHPRRWFSFSLRTLFVVMTVIAMGAALFGADRIMAGLTFLFLASFALPVAIISIVLQARDARRRGRS